MVDYNQHEPYYLYYTNIPIFSQEKDRIISPLKCRIIPPFTEQIYYVIFTNVNFLCIIVNYMEIFCDFMVTIAIFSLRISISKAFKRIFYRLCHIPAHEHALPQDIHRPVRGSAQYVRPRTRGIVWR